MLDICYEELDYLKEHIDEGKEILGYDFLDTWDFEDDIICVLKFIGFVVLLMVLFFTVSEIKRSSQSPDFDWNNGICHKCEIRYEMKDVYMGMKYYVCPECGNEVERY